MSTLRVDSLQGQTQDGTYRYIVQMKHFQLTTTQTETIASANADQAISNFTVNITPTRANSIIKLEAQLFFECANNPWDTMFFFFRDSTKLAHTGSAGSRRTGIASPVISYHLDNESSTPEMLHMGYFDSPNTTLPIAYKLGYNASANNNLHINRTVDDTDAANYERGVSWISAMEIAQ
tara:strand:- start:721 stop:1257 length:537 start_codon:yes stop_codon:yes gene_type:complete